MLKISQNAITLCYFTKRRTSSRKIGIDTLYTKRDHPVLPKKSSLTEKHGSGCVLSSAIVSNLALGNDLRTACYLAKDYIETYLQSNPTKLGYHHV
jgi:hydroxymethylpyrimidine/phosphomethylpyrimidine kinase